MGQSTQGLKNSGGNKNSSKAKKAVAAWGNLTGAFF